MISSSLIVLAQILIPLGIINVWLVRAARPTGYRGGSSTSLKAEFRAYGLPDWAYGVVGFLKLSAAALILFSLVFPSLRFLGGGVMAGLMVGALAMHLKVKDPAIKSLPAVLMLILSLCLIL